MSKKEKYTVKNGLEGNYYARSKEYPDLVGIGYSPCKALEELSVIIEVVNNRDKREVK